jgi:hypothetical protein
MAARLKVPLLLAALMVVVAAGISKAVLIRLNATQQAHFGEVNGTYLEGLATAIQPTLIRRDPWEAFDILDRARSRYQSVQARVTLVTTPDGKVLASSDPVAHPIGSEPPEALLSAPAVANVNDHAGEVWIKRELTEAGIPLGSVAALVDVTRFQAVRRDTVVTLVGFNVLLTLLLATLGWFLVRRTLEPLTRLSELLARSTEGRLQTIPGGRVARSRHRGRARLSALQRRCIGHRGTRSPADAAGGGRASGSYRPLCLGHGSRGK